MYLIARELVRPSAAGYHNADESGCPGSCLENVVTGERDIIGIADQEPGLAEIDELIVIDD
jgi:hypothetical protein